MSWENLIGQSAAKEYLRAVLRAERLSHAWLFKGPVGVGKRTGAYAFAQAVLCEHGSAKDEPCGECKSCRWFKARRGNLIEHPDIIPLLNRDNEEFVGDHEQIIKLDTIQTVCEQLHRSPVLSKRRVVIIPEAQRLCRGQAESANAFLKTLEEPPESSLIVMTTSQPEALLETITSRVQSVYFRRLSIAEIRSGMGLLHPELSEEDAAALASMADGSLGRALELCGGDLKGWRKKVLAVLQTLGPNSCPAFGLALWILADTEGERLFTAEKAAGKSAAARATESSDDETEGEVKSESGWKRYVFRRLLELCEVCFRDALILAAAGNGAQQLLMESGTPVPAGLAQKFGIDGCQKALAAIQESMYAVRIYIKGDLVGRALSGKLVEALKR